MKKIGIFCLFGGLLFNINLTGASPEPYASLTLLPYKEHGWFCPPNQLALEKIINSRRPMVVVEVGCWLGLSTCFMAERMPRGAKLYAVDHWDGSVEHHDAEFVGFLPTLYQQFLSNVVHRGLTDVIVPVRMSSKDAFVNLSVKADLVYIDASHDAESVYNDIIMWVQKLAPGGELYGDDYSWRTVREGLYRAANELGVQVEVFGGQAWKLVF